MPSGDCAKGDHVWYSPGKRENGYLIELCEREGCDAKRRVSQPKSEHFRAGRLQDQRDAARTALKEILKARDVQVAHTLAEHGLTESQGEYA
jgi:hypothetical protein